MALNHVHNLSCEHIVISQHPLPALLPLHLPPPFYRVFISHVGGGSLVDLLWPFCPSWFEIH